LCRPSRAPKRIWHWVIAMSWRDHLTVHPATDLFPLMPESELRELGEDIKKNGLRHPIIYCKGENGKPMLLDGRNRLDAMESVGIATVNEKGIVTDKNGELYNGTDVAFPSLPDVDPYDLVLSLNIHRRHLTEEQRRDLIAKLIKAKPEASDRAIAKQIKRDHKTVAKVRKKMESTGEVSPVEKRVGADGKKRKKPTAKKREENDLEFQKAVAAERELVLGKLGREHRASAEISIDERKTQMAALVPAEPNKWNAHEQAPVSGGIVERTLWFIATMSNKQIKQFDHHYKLYMAARAITGER